MGLDQWFYKSKNDCVYKKIEYYDGTFSEEEIPHLPEESEEFSYFRKHHHLNEWICYNCVPDDIVDFNCIPIELTKDMAMKLFNSVVKGEVTSKWEDHNEEMLVFLNKAFELYKEGYKIYYHAWW